MASIKHAWKEASWKSTVMEQPVGSALCGMSWGGQGTNQHLACLKWCFVHPNTFFIMGLSVGFWVNSNLPSQI